MDDDIWYLDGKETDSFLYINEVKFGFLVESRTPLKIWTTQMATIAFPDFKSVLLKIGFFK